MPTNTNNIDAIFLQQKANLPTLKARSAADRIAMLQRLKRAILRFRKNIVKAGAEDFGKPETEVDIAEIMPLLSELANTSKNLKRWMKPKRVRTPATLFGSSGKIIYEPKGASLVIAPWNYPVFLSLGPVISAVAAGCSAIIKPSEFTPALSAVIREIVEDVFDVNEVAVIDGEVETTTQLLALPFDHIFFTGSPNVGKVVMAAAAKNLSSVTLELGGKSPVIVDESANVKDCIDKLVWAKFTNNGQTCIAPDYLLVHRSHEQSFSDSLYQRIATVYGADLAAQQQSPDLARMVNTRHFDRVQALLVEAKSKAKTILGGHCDADDRFISPTLVVEPSADSRIMQEEIFGPLLPILFYDELSEALSIIEQQPKPLALYIFAKDNRVVDEVINRSTAGGTCINTCLLHFIHSNLPVGGVNNSGIGKSHGRYGFLAFSNERGVVKDHLSLSKQLFAPYTPRVKKVIQLTLRFLGR
ncbi:aldehyde dehydrogenase family protein [uncultured Umboniibacter sp.]|uniref:aldehyde dehydrogenase family protein n=1 Tax=uncultured Umboniibacter sp. TaxID=1798917 RepID=UPI00262A5917|nr:aldehyde dehydrogenase family protein [uncultured Umboniibacter sp.]